MSKDDVRSFIFRSQILRQTVFYTNGTLLVSEGQDIVGELQCAPNLRNNRDLDIRITYGAEGEESETMNYKMCGLNSSLSSDTVTDGVQVLIFVLLHFIVIGITLASSLSLDCYPISALYRY